MTKLAIAAESAHSVPSLRKTGLITKVTNEKNMRN